MYFHLKWSLKLLSCQRTVLTDIICWYLTLFFTLMTSVQTIVITSVLFSVSSRTGRNTFDFLSIWTPFFFLQSIRKYQFKVLEKSDSLWFVLKIKYCSWKLFLQFPQCVMLTLTFSKGNAMRNFDYKNSALWDESRNLEGGWEKCFI